VSTIAYNHPRQNYLGLGLGLYIAKNRLLCGRSAHKASNKQDWLMREELCQQSIMKLMKLTKLIKGHSPIGSLLMVTDQSHLNIEKPEIHFDVYDCIPVQYSL
jgi:hypothetical protein